MIARPHVPADDPLETGQDGTGDDATVIGLRHDEAALQLAAATMLEQLERYAATAPARAGIFATAIKGAVDLAIHGDPRAVPLGDIAGPARRCPMLATCTSDVTTAGMPTTRCGATSPAACTGPT